MGAGQTDVVASSYAKPPVMIISTVCAGWLDVV